MTTDAKHSHRLLWNRSHQTLLPALRGYVVLIGVPLDSFHLILRSCRHVNHLLTPRTTNLHGTPSSFLCVLKASSRICNHCESTRVPVRNTMIKIIQNDFEYSFFIPLHLACRWDRVRTSVAPLTRHNHTSHTLNRGRMDTRLVWFLLRDTRKGEVKEEAVSKEPQF